MEKHVLVIDDDNLVVKSIEKYLKSKGYNVEVALSGQEALEKTEHQDFDIIVSDMRMPGMDGIETLRRIRASSSLDSKGKIPTIIITGYAGGDEISRNAGELGIAECIYKPFELDEFIAAIEKNINAKTIIGEEKGQPVTSSEILPNYKLLDEKFIALIDDIKGFLQEIKNGFDEFDKNNNDDKKVLELINSEKKIVFNRLDAFFDGIWDIVKNLERDKYIIHQRYAQEKLRQLLVEGIEINEHIYNKPLGYPGDFIMMNYIYDYSGGESFLGKSSYEKIMNNYTCNIPISRSNITRKEFLKSKIEETLGGLNEARILSVACGPARELIELVSNGRINRPLEFKCLDFEMQVLDYINMEIEKIPQKYKEHISLRFLCRDITALIRDKKLKNDLMGQDLVYAFGIFDYLSERMSSRLLRELFQLVNNKGKLILCNISLEQSSHRGCYEFIGEWNMVHRTKREMLGWANDLHGVGKVSFGCPPGGENYLFLILEKT